MNESWAPHAVSHLQRKPQLLPLGQFRYLELARAVASRAPTDASRSVGPVGSGGRSGLRTFIHFGIFVHNRLLRSFRPHSRPHNRPLRSFRPHNRPHSHSFPGAVNLPVYLTRAFILNRLVISKVVGFEIMETQNSFAKWILVQECARS